MTSELPLGRSPGFPEAAYHADPGYGSGSIKALAESPARFLAERSFRKAATDAMDLGSAFHMRLLQPERFERSVVTKPTGLSFATKAGIAWRDGVLSQAVARGVPAGEVIFLTPEQMDSILWMAEGRARIVADLGLDPFEEPGESECAYFWNDESGVRGKALVDRELTDLPWIVDVKTTARPLDAHSIQRSAADFGWAIQAAWYVRGVRACRPVGDDLLFGFAVFQSVPPFSVRFMPVPPETMVRAERLVERALLHARALPPKGAPRGTVPDAHSGLLEIRYPDWFPELALPLV